MTNLKRRTDCPVSTSLDIFGDKWSLLIIRDLMYAKRCTYSDFLRAGEGFASNLLASRLINLEGNGLIEKMEHPESRAKVWYKLTPMGIDLLPVLIEMSLWAEKYFPIDEKRRAMLQEVKKDKEGFLRTAKSVLSSAI